jgi:hypothetical protein
MLWNFQKGTDVSTVMLVPVSGLVQIEIPHESRINYGLFCSFENIMDYCFVSSSVSTQYNGFKFHESTGEVCIAVLINKDYQHTN